MIRKGILRTISIVLLLFAVTACGVRILPVGEAPRISAERLNGMLGDKAVIVVDVRHEILWQESENKIRGAVRGDAKSIKWAEKYPKDAFLVLYCS
jgi:hypothetical protein